MAGVQWLDWYGDGRLLVVDVGLACCALEFEAAALELGAPASAPAVVAGAQVVVVVSGTVTDRLAPAVVAIVDAVQAETGRVPTVVSFGACASSGGPYWDSYAVTKGIDQLLAVDVYVPGCPPPPEALEAVLAQIVRSGNPVAPVPA